MNKEPETYEELIRKKRCIDLAMRYSLTENDLELIYQFLTINKTGQVVGNQNSLSLMVGANIYYVIPTNCIDSSIDGLTMSNSIFRVIPHYVPSSNSDNNNNNNNNNNR